MILLTYEKSVLIHSACGGVGLAAIQLAHMIGAEVGYSIPPVFHARPDNYTDLLHRWNA